MAAGALGYGIVKGWPPKLRNAAAVHGQVLRIEELGHLDPSPLRLGIVGPSRTGKTTLINSICLKQWPHARTEELYAVVWPLPRQASRDVAFLDGEGNSYSQQFRIAEEADLLVIVLDHNTSDTSANLEELRLSTEDDFLGQLKDYLKERKKRLKHVHFLLNKQDLWRGQASEGQLTAWFSRWCEDWRGGNWAEKVTSRVHSNMVHDDVVEFVTVLRGACNEVGS